MTNTISTISVHTSVRSVPGSRHTATAISCKSAQPVPARVEEPVNPERNLLVVVRHEQSTLSQDAAGGENEKLTTVHTVWLFFCVSFTEKNRAFCPKIS